MSKFCKPMGLYVTYLDCMECEDKECMKTKEEGKMNTIRLPYYIGTEVFVVLRSKREGHKKNIVLKCKITEIRISEKEIIYVSRVMGVVTKTKPEEGIEKSTKYYTFRNSDVDTGNTRNHMGVVGCPVFSTKEKCIEWLKG